MEQSEYFHVGIVVEDLVEARARFTELIGVEWGPILERQSGEFTDAAGSSVEGSFRLCYSTAAPYIELIEELPGSEWECNEHSNLHHIGYWSESVDADSANWSNKRCPMRLCRLVDGEKQAAYHRTLGVRLELVNTALRPRIEALASAPPTTA